MPPIPTGYKAVTLVAAGLLTGLLGLPARSQTTGVGPATGSASLGTLVNGSGDGSCTSGLCTISGGTGAGSNLFHRLASLNTTGAITGVSLLNGGFSNVVVGVTSPTGSVIDKPFALQNPASLTLLSPGGISILSGGSFSNITQLNLSTATGMRVGTGFFDVFNTTSTQATQLSGVIQSGSGDLSSDPDQLAANAITGSGDVVIDSGLITVENGLLVDSQFGNVVVNLARITALGNGDGDGGSLRLQAAQELLVRDSQLLANATSGVGGQIDLLGNRINLEGSLLEASGPLGGGTIQVGGGWQGANIGGPNASSTFVDGGTQLIADGLVNGDGGTIVVWADGSTAFSGHAQARGGSTSGNGGNIEISGKQTLAMGGTADTRAPNGEWGNLLLDPGNLFVIDGSGSLFSGVVTGVTNPNNFFFQNSTTANLSTSSNSYITDERINLLLTTGSVTLQAINDIALMSDTFIETISAPSNLTLTSTNGNIYIGAEIDLAGGGNISFEAPNGAITSAEIASSLGSYIVDASFSAVSLLPTLDTNGNVILTGQFNTPFITSSGGAINLNAATINLSADISGGSVFMNAANFIGLDSAFITTAGDISIQSTEVTILDSFIGSSGGSISIGTSSSNALVNIAGSAIATTGGNIDIGSTSSTVIIGDSSGALLGNTFSFFSGGDLAAYNTALITQGGDLTITSAFYSIADNALLDTTNLYDSSGVIFGSTTPGALRISGTSFSSSALCDSSGGSCAQPLIIDEISPDLNDLLFQFLISAAFDDSGESLVEGEFTDSEESSDTASDSAEGQDESAGSKGESGSNAERLDTQAINNQIGGPAAAREQESTSRDLGLPPPPPLKSIQQLQREIDTGSKAATNRPNSPLR